MEINKEEVGKALDLLCDDFKTFLDGGKSLYDWVEYVEKLKIKTKPSDVEVFQINIADIIDYAHGDLKAQIAGAKHTHDWSALIEKLSTALEGFKDGKPLLFSDLSWRDIKECNPPIGIDIIVSKSVRCHDTGGKYGGRRNLRLHHEVEVVNINEDLECCKVGSSSLRFPIELATHWQPLPSPYYSNK